MHGAAPYVLRRQDEPATTKRIGARPPFLIAGALDLLMKR